MIDKKGIANKPSAIIVFQMARKVFRYVMIKALFKKRKKALHSVGIDVTEKQLLSFYK